jgi:hypothetical protein
MEHLNFLSPHLPHYILSHISSKLILLL